MTAPKSQSRALDEPTDPDVDLGVPARRQQSWRVQGPIVTVVALGGGIGAAARYGASLLWPVATGGFPWTTLCVNTLGCAVIGVFMVIISDVWAAHRLVRPFFGTGVLGGFTTFSPGHGTAASRGRAITTTAEPLPSSTFSTTNAGRPENTVITRELASNTRS